MIELLYKSKIFSNKNNYVILKIGNIDESLIKEFYSLMNKIFKDINLSFTSNIKEALNLKNSILLVQLGKLNFKDIEKMNEDLSFQENNIKGIIYFK